MRACHHIDDSEDCDDDVPPRVFEILGIFSNRVLHEVGGNIWASKALIVLSPVSGPYCKGGVRDCVLYVRFRQPVDRVYRRHQCH